MFIAFSCLTSIINTLGKSEYVYSILFKKMGFFSGSVGRALDLLEGLLV